MSNATVELSSAEKELVRNNIKKKLQEISSALEMPEICEARDKFIEMFIVCETVYKIVLKKYLEVNNKYDPHKHLKIQIEQVKTAFRKAGYIPDVELLNRLFNSSGIYKKRGSKSAKLLRDGIEHEMNVGDMKEVKDRFDNLMRDMESFLKWIQN